MASGNEFSTIFSVEFEDLASVKAKLDVLKKKIGQSNTSGIKIDVDTSSINKMIDDINKLSKTNIQVLPDGQIRMINTLNDELGKTVKLTTDLSTGKSKIDLTNDFAKQTKEEQKLIEQIAKGREQSELKRIQNNKKLEEVQAKAINKEIENSKKIQENSKKEEQDAKNLIEFEKQKLQIRQKNIELNRGSLIDKNNSKQISDNILTLDGKTTKEVKENVRQLSLELDKLDQNARLKGVEVGQKSVSSLGDAFKSTANKLGIFLSTTVVLRELMQQMRDATQYIIDMDKSMTNIMMITGKTSSEVRGITEEFKQLGSQLHTTNKEMMDSSEEMLRAGYDTDTSKKMMEASVIGSKVSGQTSKVVSEQLIAIKNAFNMTGEEMEGVIDKMARLDNTSATSFQELAEATKRTAFSAQEMGTSFSDLLAYITTASEKTRKPAETIGESMKSIYSRYSNIKLGNLDEDGKSINDVEQALGRLNIKLRDGKDSFRDYDVVLKEFMDKIKQGDVSQIDKLAVVQALAGTRQKETLLAIIENTDTLKKHQDDLMDSTGKAREMFDNAYSDSLDARINDLNRSFEGLYDSVLKSSTLKIGIKIPTDAINGISFLINKLGTLPVVITTVVGALTMFNSKFRESTSTISRFVLESTGLQQKINILNTNYTKRIEVLQTYINKTREEIAVNQSAGLSTVKLSSTLGILQGQLLATTVKMAMLKVGTIALQTAMTMGLSLGISLIISKLSGWVDSMITTKAELKELNQEFNNSFSESNDKIGNAEQLIAKYGVLSGELKKLSKGTDEYTSTEQELQNVQSQLIQLYPQSSSAIDGNTDSKNLNIEATKKLVEQDKLLSQAKANEILDKNKIDNAEDLLKLAEATKQARDEMQKYIDLKNQGVNTVKVEEYDQFGLKTPVNKDVNELLKESTKLYEDNKIKLDATTNAVSMLSDKNITFKGALEQVEGILFEETEAVNENTQAKENNKNTDIGGINADSSGEIDEVTNALVSLGYTADEVKDKMKDMNITDGLASTDVISEATTRFGEVTNSIQSAYEMIEKLNEAGSMTPSLMVDIAKQYPDIGENIFQVSDAQEFLNGKIADMESIQSDAIQIMRGNDQSYYQELLSQGNSLQDAVDNWASNFIDINSESYRINVNDFQTLNEAKSGIAGQLTNALAEYIAKWTNDDAEKYAIDLSSFTSLAQQKVYVLQKLDDEIAKVQQNYNNLISSTAHKAGNQLLDASKKLGNPMLTDRLNMQFNGLSDMMSERLQNLQNERQKVNASFSQFNKTFAKTSPNLSWGKGDYLAGGKGSGSKGGSGSKASEKQVEDIDNLKDRYYELDLALQKVENSMAMLNTQMKNAKDEEKIKLIKEEVALLTKKKQALENIYKEQQKEIQDYRNALYNQGGFTFNGDDTIHNYTERMDELRK